MLCPSFPDFAPFRATLQSKAQEAGLLVAAVVIKGNVFGHCTVLLCTVCTALLCSAESALIKELYRERKDMEMKCFRMRKYFVKTFLREITQIGRREKWTI
jgi:hypothetical protein